jgi:hypothetical protein
MSWFSDLFHGGKNPADTANQYFGQIPGATKPYYDPYINAGKGQLPGIEDIIKKLTGNPGGFMNEIGKSYQESPGLKNQIAQAMQGAGHAAAAGGMAGSPQHEQENMQLSNDIASKDYNNWMQNALGLFGSGFQGSQNVAGMGQKSGSDYANMIAQALAQQGVSGFAGQSQQNDWFRDLLKALGQGVGGIGGLFGGGGNK